MLDPKKGGRPEMGRAYCCAAHCISCVFFPPYKMGNVNREEGQPYRKYQEVTKVNQLNALIADLQAVE